MRKIALLLAVILATPAAAQIPAGVDCSGGSGCNFAGQYSGKIDVVATMSSSDGSYTATYTVSVDKGVAYCAGNIKASSKSAEAGAKYNKNPASLPFNGPFEGRSSPFTIVLPGFEERGGEYSIRSVCPVDHIGTSFDLQDLESPNFAHLTGSRTDDWESDPDNGIKGSITYKWDLARGGLKSGAACETDSTVLARAREQAAAAARDVQSSFLATRALAGQLSAHPNIAKTATFLKSRETAMTSAFAAREVASGNQRYAAEAAYGRAVATVTAQHTAMSGQVSLANAASSRPGQPVDPRLSQLSTSLIQFTARAQVLQTSLGILQKALAAYEKCLGIRPVLR